MIENSTGLMGSASITGAHSFLPICPLHLAHSVYLPQLRNTRSHIKNKPLLILDPTQGLRTSAQTTNQRSCAEYKDLVNTKIRSCRLNQTWWPISVCWRRHLPMSLLDIVQLTKRFRNSALVCYPNIPLCHLGV